MCGQIFRYVNEALKIYKEQDIFVLCLYPNHHSMPSDYSATEERKGINGIPKIVQDNIIIKDYVHDIYCWISKISESN